MNEKTIAIINRPFDPKHIKTRLGPDGKTLSYAEVQTYVDRLNEAFGNEWSFELARREQTEDQVIVEVRLTAGNVIKTGLGGASIIRRRDNGEVVDLANDYKRAEADALKRACRLLGIGAELYGSEQDADDTGTQVGHTNDGEDNPRSQPPPRERLTSAQLGAIKAISRKQGLDSTTLRRDIKAKFGVEVEYLSKKQASEVISGLDGGRPGNGSNGHRPWAGEYDHAR